jgi:hypothetical protein
VFDCALDELIQADALGCGCLYGSRVQAGIDARIEAPGKMADRLDAVFFTHFEESR